MVASERVILACEQNHLATGNETQRRCFKHGARAVSPFSTFCKAQVALTSRKSERLNVSSLQRVGSERRKRKRQKKRLLLNQY